MWTLKPSTSAIWGAQVKRRETSVSCMPTSSAQARDQDVLKTANLFVCLDNTHSGARGEDIDVENHPFCFCFSVLLSYSRCFFLRLLPSYCRSLSFNPFHLSIRFSPAVSVWLSLFHAPSLSHLFWFFNPFNLLACRLPVLHLHDQPWTAPYIWIFACLCASTYMRPFGLFPEVRLKLRSDCSNHARRERCTLNDRI